MTEEDQWIEEFCDNCGDLTDAEECEANDGLCDNCANQLDEDDE